MKARGNVENWLGLVEESMMVSLKKLTKAAITDFDTKPRHEWATQHASQVSLPHQFFFTLRMKVDFMHV